MEEPSAKRIEVVAGLIFDGQKLLVCQRRHDGALALKWEFPGGKLELGESPSAALARELKEELDIDAGAMRIVHQHIHSYPGGPHVSLSFFHVMDYQGEIKNLIFEQIAWSKLSELANFDFLDGDLPLVRRLASGGFPVDSVGGQTSQT